jgi:hypothetical protein
VGHSEETVVTGTGDCDGANITPTCQAPQQLQPAVSAFATAPIGERCLRECGMAYRCFCRSPISLALRSDTAQ